MFQALFDGLRSVRRSFGLAVAILLVNFLLALALAVPFTLSLARDLRQNGADMIYHLDYGVWSEWNEAQSGYAKSFSPDILGVGLVFNSGFALLRGELPGGVFRAAARDAGPDPPGLDPAILALGAGYLAVQTFLLGGVLAVFRADAGRWTVRGLVRDSGRYAGRMFSVALLALVAAGFVFQVDGLLGTWADAQARNAVSERTAVIWSFSRYACLLAALCVVSMVSGYAKVIVVLEDRSSALFAWLAAIAYVAANPRRTIGHYLAVCFLGIVLLFVWRAVDFQAATRGFRSQVASMLLTETMLLGGVCLRLTLLAGQMALLRASKFELRSSKF
jgi:hypothetical protein